ncbi:DNA glycosylase [Stereum hirsutum FP-91666 SS1]|uniref:DNA glycosylase n=1 Tax=Stereum hirsutum (strain FP-91666) TaxID=721885 RepID=UPI000440FE23|nr:DNA glycosylase [Stereum hirsutum FP-91666 SS1]EIM89344.1 DNA glycosylase [Stereum hirsutum FP-91666 SS1]
MSKNASKVPKVEDDILPETKRTRSHSVSSLSSLSSGPASAIDAPSPTKRRKPNNSATIEIKPEPSTPSRRKRVTASTTSTPAKRSTKIDPDSPTAADRQRTKKLSILSEFSSTSPFPTYPHPTPSEAEEVYQILAAAHPGKAHVRKPVAGPSIGMTKNSAETCGRSPNVLDALIGTILSQNTNSKNSTGAKKSLDAAFCFHKFSRIANAPTEDVVEAIKSGGLARRKAGIIQGLLKSVKEKWGRYSLQFLMEGRWSDEAIMRELVSYPGVGPKTAACVLLFCLGRDSFAVDTHVFRLSRVLGWVPRAKSATKVAIDRVNTQMHLDVHIPPHLKYPLHVLMVTHGRACKGCKSVNTETGRALGKEEGCVLRKWVRETESGGGKVLKPEEQAEGRDEEESNDEVIES